MTLFQQVAMWSLRAMLAWGAFEMSAGLYAAGAEHWTSLERLAGHRAAMARLQERARVVESELGAANAALANLAASAWVLTPGADETPAQTAAREFREALLELGAEAPIVDAETSNAKIMLTARWREPAATAPQILHALAARHPDSAVERLTLVHSDAVATEIVLSTPIAVSPEARP